SDAIPSGADARECLSSTFFTRSGNLFSAVAVLPPLSTQLPKQSQGERSRRTPALKRVAGTMFNRIKSRKAAKLAPFALAAIIGSALLFVLDIGEVVTAG